MIYNYSNDFSSAFYKADENVFEVFIDEEKYIWRYNNLHTELEIYEGKWVSCGNDLPQLIQRFASIHHGKKFMKDIKTDDFHIEMYNARTSIRGKSIEVGIYFNAEEQEEEINVTVWKRYNKYTVNYKKTNYYYTYEVLSNPYKVLDGISNDIRIRYDTNTIQ